MGNFYAELTYPPHIQGMSVVVNHKELGPCGPEGAEALHAQVMNVNVHVARLFCECLVGMLSCVHAAHVVCNWCLTGDVCMF